MQGFDIYNWAWSQGLPASTKLVVLALVKHSNPDGYCYPSVRRLVALSGLSRTTIQTQIARLEEVGLVRRDERFSEGANGEGRQTSNGYQLNLDKAVDIRNQSSQVDEQRDGDIRIVGAVTPGGGANKTGPVGQDIGPMEVHQPGGRANEPGPRGSAAGHQEPIKELGSEIPEELPVEESREIVATSILEVATSLSSSHEARHLSFSDKREARILSEIERLKGWAELERGTPKLSFRQQEGIRRAIHDLCSISDPSVVVTEVWNWDFLDASEKTRWQERVETARIEAHDGSFGTDYRPI